MKSTTRDKLTKGSGETGEVSLQPPAPGLPQDNFFRNLGRNLSRGSGARIALMQDGRRVRILSLEKDGQDILLVEDTRTGEQFFYDVSARARAELKRKEKHDLPTPMDITDITQEALDLREANGISAVTITSPTAKVVLVDSFPDLPNDAFYQNLTISFGARLSEGSQVIFVSQEPGKAQRIAALARTLGMKNYVRFVAMARDELPKIGLPTSYLLADTYLTQARALYGDGQRYFRLESPQEDNLVGVYALAPVGVLMDLISLEDWERAAQIYSQVVGRAINAGQLQAALRGALLIPFVSKLIGRLVAQVYMAERAIENAA